MMVMKANKVFYTSRENIQASGCSFYFFQRCAQMNTNIIPGEQLYRQILRGIKTLCHYCEQTKHFPLRITTAFILFLARWMSDSVDSIYSGRPPYMGMTDLNRSFHAWNTSTMYDRMPAENHRRTGCTPEVRRSGQAFFCSQNRGTVQAAPISRVRGGYSIFKRLNYMPEGFYNVAELLPPGMAMPKKRACHLIKRRLFVYGQR